MSRPALIVFDWDGTIVDSTDRIVESMRFAFSQQGWGLPDATATARLIGLPVTRMIDELSGGAPQAEQGDAIGHFATRFRQLATSPPDTFAGLKTCLETLRNDDYWLAVATGKSRRGLNRELSQLALTDTFVATRTADESRPKPHPQMMFELLDECGLEPAQVLMIGDTAYDVEMARSAGVRAVGVSWGNHSRDELLASGATAIAETLGDLPAITRTLIAGDTT